MTDEQQLRALFTRAADLPDDVRPPVARLVENARGRRRLQVVLSLLSVAAITAAAFTVPVVLKAREPVFIGRAPGPATAGALLRSHWSALPPSPVGPRSDPILAWTGVELLEVGGTRNGVIQRDGAAFDAARRQWRSIAPAPSSIQLKGAVSVWTGRLFVTSGKVAGLYDPGTNRWTTTQLPAQMAGLQLASPVWTGHDVILAGTSGSATRPRLAVASYNLATRSWRIITPHLPAKHPTSAVSLVATWHKVILWSMWSRSVTHANGSGTVRSGVDVLELRNGRWRAVTAHWPQRRVTQGAAFAKTGRWPQHWTVQGAEFAEFLILIPPGRFWCGACPGPYVESPARFADAGSLALTTIPDSPLVTKPTVQPTVWLWNGYAVLAADESGYSKAAPGGRLGRLAIYDRWSHRWHLLPNPPGNPALAAPPLFATQQLLVLTQRGDLLALGRREP
jgi:hypothetical protein